MGNCGDNCGCNHDHNEEYEAEVMYLEMEDGTELECEVIGIFEFEGKEYIVLLPNGEEEAYVYAYEEKDGEPVLSTIEDDEEYQKVSAELERIYGESQEEGTEE